MEPTVRLERGGGGRFRRKSSRQMSRMWQLPDPLSCNCRTIRNVASRFKCFVLLTSPYLLYWERWVIDMPKARPFAKFANRS